MSCFEAADSLARIGVRNGHRFPGIFITAHEDAVVREQALAAGALAFVRKPINDELLIKMLKTVWQRQED